MSWLFGPSYNYHPRAMEYNLKLVISIQFLFYHFLIPRAKFSKKVSTLWEGMVLKPCFFIRPAPELLPVLGPWECHPAN